MAVHEFTCALRIAAASRSMAIRDDRTSPSEIPPSRSHPGTAVGLTVSLAEIAIDFRGMAYLLWDS
jgi:hypothetical protein